jgi:TonB family protein
MPSNPWRCADFLERIRPGFAVSAALHIGLLLALAYILAFHQPLQVQQPVVEPPIQYLQLPKTPPKTVEVHKAPIRLDPTPVLDNVPVPTYVVPIPVEQNFDRRPAQTQTVETASQPVIINPKPIYRGGLVYPERAADAGVNGYVVFSFIIRQDGSVGDPQVIEEVPDGYGFAAAAKKAFPKWRFEPKLVDGKPIDAPAQIRVSFQLK